ncbi:TPA: autotransporter adhesin Ag43 [Escherichia coli]|nr:autotransporter adhesin Ag43 [Escherichia coli]
MKRHLNTCYRLVWNHITGAFVVASELARSRGKRGGVAVALSLAAVTSLPVLAADIVVHPGETVNGGTLANHDNQIVFGTTNGMTISTGLEYGPDNEANTGGQWVQDGGTANKTTVTSGGLQRVNPGGSVSDTVISAGGGQSLQGRAVNTTLNGGEQWVHEDGIATGTVINEKGWQAIKSGAVATDTVVNTGAEGGPDAENGDTGQFVRGDARSDGKAFSIGGGQADALMLEKGSSFTLNAGDTATDTTVNGGLFTARGGTLAGTTTLNNGAILTLSGKTVNNDTLTIREGDALLQGGSLTGNGSVEKSGSGTLTVSNTTLTQKAVNLNEGTLTLNDSTVTTDVIAQRGTALKLTGSTVLNGAIDPTNVTLASGAIWNIPDNATVQSVVDDLSHAGQIHFTSTRTGKFVPATLKVKNLNGQNGTISLRVRPDMAQNNADRLVIDGGRATGKTILNLVNAGNSASGLATSGKGIQVVEAINGATTEEGAFVQGNKLQAGAFNYSLNRDSDESWYLRSENAYRAEVPLYASMLTQAMDYDRILAGSRSHQTGVSGENNSVRLSIQGGHLGHDNNGGIARGATPESSGSYGFVRLEGDLLRTEVAGMSVTAGVYGAAGHSSVDVKDDDGSRAGTVRDDAGSLGGYLNLIHNASGLWADIVALGTRHSMKASTDNNDFRARGWGWLGSLETGLPFSITDNLMLEPRLQYTWQGLSLDDGKDNAGYVKFGHGSAQHVRAGFRLGSYNDMTFGEGTSSRDTLRDSTKHGVSELPVNWWVQPSVIRTFSSRGDMSMGTAAAGSNMTFSPSQNGTSLDLQAGLEARVRGNITLGVQAGYAHSVSGSSAEGYNGQATLNMTF